MSEFLGFYGIHTLSDMKMLNSVSLTCVVIVMIQCELQASAELANVKSDIGKVQNV